MPHVKPNMRPVHPGEYLRDELEETGLSIRELADALGVPHNRIAAILRGQRAVTADTALRLAAFFGTSAEVWLNLQKSYELSKTEQEHGDRIRATVRRHVA